MNSSGTEQLTVGYSLPSQPYFWLVRETVVTIGREDGARLDIVAENFWGRDRRNADVRVFNPAPNHRGITTAQCEMQEARV